MSDRSSAALRAFLENARGSHAGEGARIISLGERRAVVPTARWELDEIVGRLTELSGIGAVASLTAATSLVLEAQRRGEPSAWLSLLAASFYPPDLDDAGVDLDALVVVRAPDLTAMVRAADRLLRSAAFGLIVMDLGAPNGGVAPEIPIAVQGRLVGLAQHHDAAIVVLTEKPRESASLGSMVSLRAEAVRERASGGRGWRVAVRAVKDKRRGPGWSELADVVGPAGLP
ncbi:MAG TPA: recombinase A [Kofleriaceae bacterium]|nr:recombinase A [Kofleriaceae bacterium]